jgi:hypothetical protein
MNDVGYTLIDDNECEWLVVVYQGEILRAVDKDHYLLSEAKGKTTRELIVDLESIEEVKILMVLDEYGHEVLR